MLIAAMLAHLPRVRPVGEESDVDVPTNPRNVDLGDVILLVDERDDLTGNG